MAWAVACACCGAGLYALMKGAIVSGLAVLGSAVGLLGTTVSTRWPRLRWGFLALGGMLILIAFTLARHGVLSRTS